MRTAILFTAIASFFATGMVNGADTTCIPTEAFGCKDRKVLEEIVSYQDDPAAFGKAVRTAVMYGFCKTISGGKKVYIDDRAIFAGLRQVHITGELERYWVAEKQTSDADDACSAHAAEKPTVAAAPTSPLTPAKKPTHHYNDSAALAPSGSTAPTCEIKPVMSDQDIANCRK